MGIRHGRGGGGGAASRRLGRYKAVGGRWCTAMLHRGVSCGRAGGGGGQQRLGGWDQSPGLKGLGRVGGLVGTESARTAVTLSSTCCWKCPTAFRAPRSPPSLAFRTWYKVCGMAHRPAMRRSFRWAERRHVRTSDLTVQEESQASTRGWVLVLKASVPCRLGLWKRWQWGQGRFTGASVQKVA